MMLLSQKGYNSYDCFWYVSKFVQETCLIAAGSSVSGEVATAVSSDSDGMIEQPTEKELALWPGQKLVRAQHGGFFPKRQAPGNCANHKFVNLTSICS